MALFQDKVLPSCVQSVLIEFSCNQSQEDQHFTLDGKGYSNFDPFSEGAGYSLAFLAKGTRCCKLVCLR